MFRKRITESPFIGADADQIFLNIQGDRILDDDSFLSTMRAVLPKRMNQDEQVFLYSLRDSFPDTPHENMVYVINLTRTEDVNLEEVLRKYLEGNPGWERVERAEAWLKANRADFSILINKETRTTLIFATHLFTKSLHLVQAMMPILLPWFFSDEKKNLTDQEKALFISLGKKTSDEYEQALIELSKQYNFKEIKLRRLLDGYENITYRRQAENVKNQIELKRESISETKMRLTTLISELDSLITTEFGLQNRVESKENHLLDYFLSTDMVSLEDASQNGCITVVCSGLLENFDPEAAETVINNNRATLYYDVREENKEKMKKLLKAVFIDQEIKILICATYNVMPYDVNAVSGYNFSSEYKDYMPNPHIQEYRCMGGYARYIMDYIERGNYAGAVEQCLVSARSLNWSDSAVIAHFGRYVVSGWNSKKCYQLPDGKHVTAEEALKYIEEEEE